MYKKWLSALLIITSVVLSFSVELYAETAKAYATITVIIPERKTTQGQQKDKLEIEANKPKADSEEEETEKTTFAKTEKQEAKEQDD